MISCGLLVRLEARAGKGAEVELFLESALPLVEQETETKEWFAVRFGPNEYGIFDVFPDEAGRQAHLSGQVAAALMAQADALFEKAPLIQKFDVLAHKAPSAPPPPDTRGMLVTFRAREGCADDVEAFLRDVKNVVDDEPETHTWFAIHMESGEYGIFDTFRDHRARFKHLSGQVPRELLEQAPTLLGSVPDLDLLHVLTEKVVA